MNENNKKIVIGVGIAVVVVILAYFAFSQKGSNVSTGNKSGGAGAVGGTAGEPVKSATRQEVSSGIVVPDTTSTVSANVAKPSIVAQAAPGSSSKFRSFSLSVTGGKFVPDTVIVNAGDTVHLNITAADKDYDFYQPDYGLSTPLPKGTQKVVEFQATSLDKYTFYCKACGGPSKGPVGYVTVVK
ncbi:MAG: cupredoxin domain-containing protein [Candidatus Liptonbacteria bacterium]|nr:cupredoxin domain-containing protein [Candidatus Liptonbacteria bacterium]